MAIKILLLEDDPVKKSKLLAYLQGNRSLFDVIETALCTEDAARRLEETTFDLFVVDIVVPRVLGGEKSEQNSIALLERIDDGVDGLNRPNYILPVSSSSELSEAAFDFFLGRPWGIIPYDESKSDALATISRVAEFVVAKKGKQSASSSCDILLVTALESEFVAIENEPFDWEPLIPLDSQHMVRFGEIETNTGRRKVAATFCHRMGPVQAAILTTKAMQALKPKIVIMAGICAGIPGKADIGDVIAAEVSWDWQSGKYVDSNGSEAFEIAPHQLAIDDNIRAQLIRFKRDSAFWNSLAVVAAKHQRAVPKLILGPMATGSSVLADERVTQRIKTQQHKNVAGLDMETYGVYAAVNACDPNVPVICLKSVCDKGDTKKDDAFQPYAAEVSAKAVRQFISTYTDGIFSR